MSLWPSLHIIDVKETIRRIHTLLGRLILNLNNDVTTSSGVEKDEAKGCGVELHPRAELRLLH